MSFHGEIGVREKHVANFLPLCMFNYGRREVREEHPTEDPKALHGPKRPRYRARKIFLPPYL